MKIGRNVTNRGHFPEVGQQVRTPFWANLQSVPFVFRSLQWFDLDCSCVTHQTSFWIERSKNANIIHHNAQNSPNGKLDNYESVIACWVRLARKRGRIHVYMSF